MLPVLPDPHGLAALGLTVIALFLFTRDRIPLEASSLLILVVLVLGFQLFPYERSGVVLRPVDFIAGFGHEALITISALMIVGKGLETTGALLPLAQVTSQGWSKYPRLALFVTLFVAAALSAFLNNTPIVVMLLPVLVGVSIRAKINSTGMLMPMGLATIVGGMATTIGTSTNLLVVGIAADLGMRRFGMFDFVLPVVFAGLLGLLYLWLVAPRLLPQRTPLMSDTSPRIFNALLYIGGESLAMGKTLAEIRAMTEGRMKIDRVERGEDLFLTKLPSVTLQAGDRLYIKDSPDRLKEFERLLKAQLHQYGSDTEDFDPGATLAHRNQQLAEVVVTRGSPLHHRTLETIRFAVRYGLLPLAIHRARTPTEDTSADIGDINLRSGDVLLVQGSPKKIASLKESGTMLVLDGTTDLPHTKFAPRALGIMLFVVVTAAIGLLPISVSSLTGVGLMLLTGCLRWRDIGQSLSISVILLIVASLALGLALMVTGGAEYMAQLFLVAMSDLPVPMILSGIMLLMSLLTNIVSNNAAAVIGTPIAINIAQQLGINPEPFVLAVLFGANMSFATPIGYQTNLLVMSAGGYYFSDFLRVGVPLIIIMWLGFSFILPIMYQL